MIIEKTIQQKAVTETTYKFIADDGTEFTEEIQCRKHEAEVALNKLKIETCKEAHDIPNILVENGCVDCYNYIWYRPKTQAQMDALNEMYQIGINNDYIGEWICIETDGYDTYWSSIEDGIDRARELFNALGYEFTVKNKEKN